MAKIQTACTVEPEIYERLKLVSIVDRRSLAEVVAECIALALPQIEAELQRPRLSPNMVARLKAGETIEQVMTRNLAPFSPATLHEPAAPYRVSSPARAGTPAEAAAAQVAQAAAASPAHSLATGAPSARASQPSKADQPRSGARRASQAPAPK